MGMHFALPGCYFESLMCFGCQLWVTHMSPTHTPLTHHSNLGVKWGTHTCPGTHFTMTLTCLGPPFPSWDGSKRVLSEYGANRCFSAASVSHYVCYGLYNRAASARCARLGGPCRVTIMTCNSHHSHHGDTFCTPGMLLEVTHMLGMSTLGHSDDHR